MSEPITHAVNKFRRVYRVRDSRPRPGFHAVSNEGMAIGPGTILSLRDGTVECLSGTLWLTLEGETQDILLGPAQRLQLSGGRHALIEALGGSARLRLSQATQR